MFETDDQIRAYSAQHGLSDSSKPDQIRAVFPELPAQSEVFGDSGRLVMIDGIPGWVSSKFARN